MAAMTWYEKIIAAHTAVTDAVSHGERMQSQRYFVWCEDGANDALGDNGHAARAVTGRTDLYTRRELDPWAELLEQSFETCDIAWARVLVEFEPDTRLWHWSWDWEVY